MDPDHRMGRALEKSITTTIARRSHIRHYEERPLTIRRTEA